MTAGVDERGGDFPTPRSQEIYGRVGRLHSRPARKAMRMAAVVLTRQSA